ncbi:MAG: hypothetical protein ACLR2M_01245 [Varibaculum sp.]
MEKMSVNDWRHSDNTQTWNDLKDVRRHMPRIELHGARNRTRWMKNQMRMAGEISGNSTIPDRTPMEVRIVIQEPVRSTG